ncbi:MAG: hypothetical protein VX970_03150 [Planctomycetota bacterium]|nr:hypothetical protein [Planctomycetota bacterium]
MDRENNSNRGVQRRRRDQRGKLLCDRRGAAKQVVLLLILPIMLTLIAALLYWGWQVVWQMAPVSPQFSLHPANIEITTESRWADRSAILQQVVHEASLDDQLSLLDPGLNERLSLAIEDHPWVKSVERVEKFQPPRVEVTLRYREPVAFIARDSAAKQSQGDEICIVDREGIHLPQDLTRVDAPPVSVLAEIRGVPFQPPSPGEMWNDVRVRAAARVAASLSNDWGLLSLQAIRPASQPVVGSNETYAFMLITRGGQEIPWGPQYLDALSADRTGEPTAEEKAARLKAYVLENGIDLDGHPRTVSEPPKK